MEITRIALEPIATDAERMARLIVAIHTAAAADLDECEGALHILQDFALAHAAALAEMMEAAHG